MVEITVRPGPTAAPWSNVASGPQAWPDPPVQPEQKWPDPPVKSAAPAAQQWPDTPIPKQGQTIQPTNIPADIAATRGKAESIAGQATGVSDAASVLKGEKTPEEQQKFFFDTIANLPTEGLGKVAAVAGLAHLAETKVGKQATSFLARYLSPGDVSPVAKEAAGDLRAATGQAARDYASTAASMEPFHKYINVLPEPDRFTFLSHVENRSTGSQLPSHMTHLDPLADLLRTEFQKRQIKLEALPSTQKAQFIEDYFPHMWQDPNAAKTFAENFTGAGKQGSGASLRKRTMPTIADGIAAGLKPVTTDPIEATMRYTRSMDNYIAATAVLDAAKDNGTVRYFRPKVMGASGNPEGAAKIPEGWIPLKGRGSTSATGEQAYAPIDWARVYNNHISRGFHGNEDAGKVYDALQHGSNAITALELGLSGYHAVTMAQEAVMSEAARGIKNIVGGRFGKGFGNIVKAPFAPVRSAMQGTKAQQVYLGRTSGAPDMRKVVDLLTKAGGRAVGKGHAPDYRFSNLGNYFTSFKRGALKQEMRESVANIKAAPISGTAKEIAKNVGRFMDTIAAPIFEKYIPKLKTGAFYDRMHDWIEMNPNASEAEQLKAARGIWDSIDNRFGEVVQDDLFINKMASQSLQLALRSFSWDLGTLREIGGGVRDLSKGKITDKAAYVIAMSLTWAAVNAVYQKLKTGKNPESINDLMSGQTGGTAPGFGGRGSVPERIMPPGYPRDVFGWWENPQQELTNKMATAPRMAWEAWQNQDWKGQPIARTDQGLLTEVEDYFKWVGQSLGPISLRQLSQGEKAGSNISMPEALAGVRPAPAYLQDPEGYAKGMKAITERKWKAKETYDKRQQKQYGGTQE